MKSDLSKLSSQFSSQINSLTESLAETPADEYNFELIEQCKKIKNDTQQQLKSIDSAATTAEIENNLKKLDKLQLVIEETISKQQVENLKQREAICSSLEKAFGDPDKAKLVKLVNQSKQLWKKVGPVSNSDYKTISTRFEGDCRRLLDDCHDYLDEQVSIQEETVKTRKQIIENLRKIGQLSDGDLLVRNRKRVKELVEKWKAEPNLNYKNLSLNKEFKEALDAFYRNLEPALQEVKSHRNKRFATKQELMKKLEELITHTTDTGNRYKSASHLYQNWIREKMDYDRESQDLEKKFQTAFEDLLTKLGHPLEKRITVKEKVITAMEELATEGGSPKLERIVAVQNEWKVFHPIPFQENKLLRDKFQAAQEKVFQKFPALIEELNKLKTDLIEQKKGILEEVKELIGDRLPTPNPKGTNSKSAKSSMAMDDYIKYHQEKFQQKSQQKSQQISLDQAQNNQPINHSKLMDLIKRWEGLGHIGKTREKDIDREYRKIISRYFNFRKKVGKIKKTSNSEIVEKKRQLVARLKLLRDKVNNKNSGVPPKDSGKLSIEDLKIQWEMNRQFAYSSKNKKQEIRSELNAIQKEWQNAGRAFQMDGELLKEYRSLSNEIFQQIKSK